MARAAAKSMHFLRRLGSASKDKSSGDMCVCVFAVCPQLLQMPSSCHPDLKWLQHAAACLPQPADIKGNQGTLQP